MNKNKGFTIVEISIVLIVIGIIMLMAFKMSSAVSTSRLKSEIAKVGTIQSAFSIYYERFNRVPGLTVGQDTISVRETATARAQLVGLGVITEDQFIYGAIQQLGAGTDYWWSFVRCVPVTAAGYLFIVNTAINNTNTVRGNVCLTLTNSNNPDKDSFVSVDRLYGAYEIFNDDRNTTTGMGRFGNGQAAINPETMLDSAAFGAVDIGNIYAIHIFGSI